jgi:tetratricopeptide (TPR) repeat protein
MDRPWLGWGPENFETAFLAHYDPCFGNARCGGNTLFDRPHNAVLDALVQTGVLGLLGYLSLFVVAIWSVWRCTETGACDRRVTLLFTSLLIAYFVQNLALFDTVVTRLWLVFAFAFASSALGQQNVLEPSKTSILMPILQAFATLALPFTLFFFVVQPLQAGLAVVSVTQMSSYEERYRLYHVALDGSPLGRNVRRAYLGFNEAKLLWSFRPETDRAKLELQASALKREAEFVSTALAETVRESPNEFRSYVYLIEVLHAYGRLFEVGDFSRAHESLDEAIGKNPNSPRLRWIRVALLLEEGMQNQAQESVRVALELNETSGRSQWNRLVFATITGDMQGQADAAVALQDHFPAFAASVESLLASDVKENRLSFFHAFYLE